MDGRCWCGLLRCSDETCIGRKSRGVCYQLGELVFFSTASSSFSAYVPSIKHTKEQLTGRVEQDYAELCRFGKSAEQIRAMFGRMSEMAEQGIGLVGVEDVPPEELRQYVQKLKTAKKEVSEVNMSLSGNNKLRPSFFFGRFFMFGPFSIFDMPRHLADNREKQVTTELSVFCFFLTEYS